MGVRISKAIGYGFDDYAGSDDPRFAVSLRDLWTQMDEDSETWSLDAFQAFAVRRRQEEKAAGKSSMPYMFVAHELERQLKRREDKTRTAWSPLDMLVNENEAFPNLFLLCGPGHRRHNDDIDYYNEIAERGDDPSGLTGSLHFLAGGINPFGGPEGGAWIDRRTKQVIDKNDVHFILTLPPDGGAAAEFLERAGYASMEDFQANATWQIPWDVQVFCEWTGVFRDPATMWAMRPMIMTCWG